MRIELNQSNFQVIFHQEAVYIIKIFANRFLFHHAPDQWSDRYISKPKHPKLGYFFNNIFEEIKYSSKLFEAKPILFDICCVRRICMCLFINL